MSNFLEELVAEWYDYQGYFVKRNIKVGKLAVGGYESELDVVAFNPNTKHLVHIEPSTDAHSWEQREIRYTKKFNAGKAYIPTIFAGFSDLPEPEQIALLVVAGRTSQKELGGGKVVHILDFLTQIVNHFTGVSILKSAISEQYMLLRMVQFMVHFKKDLFESVVE